MRHGPSQSLVGTLLSHGDSPVCQVLTAKAGMLASSDAYEDVEPSPNGFESDGLRIFD